MPCAMRGGKSSALQPDTPEPLGQEQTKVCSHFHWPSSHPALPRLGCSNCYNRCKGIPIPPFHPILGGIFTQQATHLAPDFSQSKQTTNLCGQRPGCQEQSNTQVKEFISDEQKQPSYCSVQRPWCCGSSPLPRAHPPTLGVRLGKLRTEHKRGARVLMHLPHSSPENDTGLLC